MHSLIRVVAVGLALVAYPLVSAAQAPPSLIGSWKQNMAKSKADPGPLAKSAATRVEAAPGGGAKFTVDGVDAAGKATHSEYVSLFDGMAVEVTGAEAPTTRTYTRIDDRTFQFVDRVNGKVTTTTRVTISADGKIRTNVGTGTNAAGKPVNNTSVYERQ